MDFRLWHRRVWLQSTLRKLHALFQFEQQQQGDTPKRLAQTKKRPPEKEGASLSCTYLLRLSVLSFSNRAWIVWSNVVEGLSPNLRSTSRTRFRAVV